MKLLACGLLCIAPAAFAQNIADDIFNSGLEPAIVLQGTAGYPSALKSATVEGHFGSYVATTLTKADGTYSLVVETRYLSVVSIVEMFVFGHGADAALVWASPLGPSDRLQSLVVGGVVAFPTEPFLNLNPRTTAMAATLRAYNAFAPITDKLTFYKAARSYQSMNMDLTFGLALIARGDQSLPAGATNTFAAVATLAPAQHVYADERSLAAVDCTTTPTAPFCVVKLSLPTDPAIVPAAALTDGLFYAGIGGFYYGSYEETGLRPNGATADVFGFFPTPITANLAQQVDGSYTLTRPGNASFVSSDDYPLIGGNQVHRHGEAYKICLRASAGAGGQGELQGTQEHTYTYPENPEILQPVVVTDPWELPNYAGADALPSELAALVPDVTGKGFVLVLPFEQTVNDGTEVPYGYDVYRFASNTTERTSKPFTFSGAGTPTLTLNFTADSMTADVRFINEEQPGIWRVRMHAVAPGVDGYFQSLLLETINTAGGYTAANIPGSYSVNLNGDICDGPWGQLSQLDPNTFCTPFGWIFGASNTVNRLANGNYYGTWQLPGGPDAGRLLFATPSFVAPTINQERGWEMVRSDGANDLWNLENVTNSPDGTTSAPPVVFKPTGRLSHVTKQ